MSKYAKTLRCRPCGVELTLTVDHKMPEVAASERAAQVWAFRERHQAKDCKVEEGDGATGW